MENTFLGATFEYTSLINVRTCEWWLLVSVSGRVVAAIIVVNRVNGEHSRFVKARYEVENCLTALQILIERGNLCKQQLRQDEKQEMIQNKFDRIYFIQT